MVFTDQCNLPTRSPGSSRGFSNISVLARRNSSVDIFYCLMDFVQAFRMLALGNFEV